MTEFAKSVRVGPKGQVVIPKEIREKLGIRPGEDVLVDSEAGAARVRRPLAASHLRGLVRDGATTADVEKEHRRERQREDARLRDSGRSS